MSALVGLLVVALLVAAGWWPMTRLLPDASIGRAGRASLAFALGAAVVGLSQVALGLVGVRATIALPALLAGVSVIASLRGPRATPSPRGPVPWPLLVVAVVGTSAVAGLPFRSDGGTFWAPKARELSRFAAVEAPSLHDETRLALHRSYPLLVPSLLAPAFALSPRDAQVGPKLVLAAFVLATLGWLAARLRCGGPRALALLLGFGTLPFLVNAEVRESLAVAGYVDAALALFLLLAVDAADRLRRGGTREDLALAALAGAAAIATKLEGATALVVVAIAWLLSGPRRLAVLPWVAYVAALALPTWMLTRGVVPDQPILDPERLTGAGSLVSRSVPVLAGLRGLLLDASRFGLAPLLLLACWPGRGRRAFPTWLALGALGVIALAYLGTTMHVGRHVFTSAHRLGYQWLPALVLLVGRAHAEEAADARG